MQERNVGLIIGGLLHDIGKVIYRKGDDMRNHSIAGYDYLKENNLIDNDEILNCIKYHHASEIKKASNLSNDSLAYIIYMADNIAAMIDRREKDDGENGFTIHTPLQPIFDILNKNNQNNYYEPDELKYTSKINYPISEKKEFSEELYSRILMNITENLRGIQINDEYINSLLEVLEANLSYVPSSTANKERCDIALFDHLKLTAAFAISIKKYFDELNIDDYKENLYINGKDFYDKKVFMLASLDISGIQKFIYTITTSNALKTLRTRSFYLEIFMQHCIDMILEELELSRTNLIYSGGGHCYLLLPNTKIIKEKFNKVLSEINEWILENFDIQLFVAGGYVECSSNELRNSPNGSYQELYEKLSNILSKMKSKRYSVAQIKSLNSRDNKSGVRECKVCKTSVNVNNEGECEFCNKIKNYSKNILHKDCFTVKKQGNSDSLKLPGDYYLVAESKDELKKSMLSDDYKRAYVKNDMYTGKHIATKIWVGDYSTKDTFEEFAKNSKGIDRIGVLRADVDSLGNTFKYGFKNTDNQDRYVTLSRTATLSRQMSLFFKLYINMILSESEHIFNEKQEKKRKCSIVYSGGDDIFIVGSWDDIICFSIDLKNKLKKYTENTLTISAGLGIYEDSYPISVIASEVEDMEDSSKKNKDKYGNIVKDSITIFKNMTYRWDEFEEKVLGEKFEMIRKFFAINSNYGMSYLYNVFELITHQEQKINFARLIYLLSRMEPEKDSKPEVIETYKEFVKNILSWINNEDDKSQLICAILIYVYMNRDDDKEKEVIKGYENN